MSTLQIARKALALIGILGIFAAATSAQATTTWQESHPRRAEVNGRLGNQNARIKNQVKDGNMSKAQAANLHHDDHQIRQEERDMASQNGGHITKSEQHTLNQQENGVSRQIGQ
ncbi:MAG TPA: hypothetical protein VK832_18560 [Burkholderiaceae bacterium]|nr:hypothetical protein [Burkholderiaceae bacterium]